MLGFVWPGLARVLYILSEPLWVYMCKMPGVYRNHYFLVFINHLWLLQCFCPFFCNGLWTTGEDVICMFHLGLSTSQFLIHYMLTSCGSQSSTLSTVERVSLMRFQKCANVWVKRQVTRSWFNTMFIWQNQRSTFSTRAYEMPNYWRSWLW